MEVGMAGRMESLPANYLSFKNLSSASSVPLRFKGFVVDLRDLAQGRQYF